MGCINSKQRCSNAKYMQNVSQLLTIECITRQVFTQSNGIQSEKSQSPYLIPQELIKEINFEELIQDFKIDYQKTFNSELKSIQKYDIKTLEIIIQSLWSQIISDTLMNVNENKITINQCKVFIAQSMLLILIQSINYTIKNYTISHANALFQRLNIFGVKICTYFKTQYSRGKKIDAGNLIKEFKEFDYTDKFKYDIIRKAGVLFKTHKKKFQYNSSYKIEEKYPFDQSDSDRQSDNQTKQKISWFPDNGCKQRAQFEITNNIKILLNRLMDQTDKNYSKFEEMIKKIDSQFKIGRKISQNTSRCSLLDNGIVEIYSDQVDRVLVKWLKNLQEIISEPGRILTQNYELKVAKFDQYNSYYPVEQINVTHTAKQKKRQNENDNTQKKYSHIDKFKKLSVTNPQQIPKSLPKMYGKCKANEWQIFAKNNAMIEKLLQKSKDLQKKDLEDKQYFKQFSTSILQNLQKVKFEQREISRQKMEIVKYSHEISNLISQIVESKLISTIQILTQLAEQNQLKNGVPNLIKFKVNDLMRCQISGNKNTIKQVYDKIRSLDSEGEIQIVKIKNRFSTGNHDAMVFFRMKGSFLLCECQLALTDEKDKNDTKIKNISELNHFFYELERSPFGIFGQLAVFQKTESTTVSQFHEKLKLKLPSQRVDRLKAIYQINKNKQEQLKQQENKQGQKQYQGNNERPYVCSICFQYYNRMSSISTLKFSHNPAAINVCNNCFESNIFDLREEEQKSDQYQQSQSQEVFKSLNDHLINQKSVSYFIKQKPQKVEEMFELIDEEQIENNINSKLIQSKESKEENQDTDDKKDKNSQGNENITKEKPTRKLKLNKMKAEQLMKFLDIKESEAISAGWKVFFVIFSTIGSLKKFVLYRYDWSQGVIENVYSPIQKYLKHEQLRFNSTSKMFLFKLMYKSDISGEKRKNERNQKKDKNQETFELCKDKSNSTYLFDYQSETMHKKQIDTSINEFYFIFKLQTINKIYFFIDAEKYKGNGRNDCLIQELNKLPAIKNLKSKIDLSNLAANDKALQEVNKILNNQSSANRNNDQTSNQNTKSLHEKKKHSQNTMSSLSRQKYPQNKKKSASQHKIPQNTANSSLNEKHPQNKISYLSYSWVKDIKILDLSHNKLVDVIILWEICPNLKVLDLSDNKIKQFQTHKNHEKLTKLYLNGNKISLFKDKKNLKSIEIFNLNKNSIKTIVFTQIPKIKILNLSENNLNQFKDEAKLNSVEILSLNNNKIQKINWTSMPQLKILNLSENKLQKFEDEGKIISIEELLLNNNEINILNCTQMPKLKKLNLSYNKLQTLIFEQSSIIEQLYLDANNLTDQKLTSTKKFNKQRKLEVSLYKQIKMNQKEAFNFKLSHLRILSIKQNELSTLSILVEKLFLKDKQLAIKELRLDNNFFLYGVDEGPTSKTGIKFFFNQSNNESSNSLHNPETKNQIQPLSAQEIKFKFSNLASQTEQKNQPLQKQLSVKHQSQEFQGKREVQNDQKQPQDKTVRNKNSNIQKEAQIINKLLQDNVKFSIPVKKDYLSESQKYLNVLLNIHEEWLKLKKEDKQQNKSQSQLIKKRLLFTKIQSENRGLGNKDDKDQKYWKSKPIAKGRVVEKELEKEEEGKEDMFQSINYLYMKCWCLYYDSQIKWKYRKSQDSESLYSLDHQRIPINMKIFFKFDWQMLGQLNLHHCKIDDGQWDKFTKHVGQKIPNLKRLYLKYNQIEIMTKQQLQQFSSSIQSITLYANPLSYNSKTQIEKFMKDKIQNDNKQIKILFTW